MSWAYGINDVGQVVGLSQTKAGGMPHAFVWSQGVMRDLGTLGGQISVAHGVNEAGQVVGFAENRVGPLHAFVWSRGIMKDLGDAGKLGPTTWATGINSAGHVVGGVLSLTSHERDGRTHGVLWCNEKQVDLNDLLDSSGAGWTIELACAINDEDQIAACAYDSSTKERRAVLLTPLKFPRSRS